MQKIFTCLRPPLPICDDPPPVRPNPCRPMTYSSEILPISKEKDLLIANKQYETGAPTRQIQNLVEKILTPLSELLKMVDNNQSRCRFLYHGLQQRKKNIGNKKIQTVRLEILENSSSSFFFECI